MGVQIETIKLWRRLAAQGLPRFVFVNKMEKERADFDRCVADLTEKFKAAFVPVVIPIGAGPGFKGVVDLVDQKAFVDGKEPRCRTPRRRRSRRPARSWWSPRPRATTR